MAPNSSTMMMLPLPLARQDDHDERTAISEIDGQLPREWAEGFALLQTMRPPPGWPMQRWRRMIDDAGRFLDRWAAQAAALGWSTCDLFGVHPAAPWARTDAMGLLPLINGATVEAITADTATLRLASDSR